MKKLLLWVILTTITVTGYSQDGLRPIRFIEFGGGPVAYRGDLAPNFERWAGVIHLGLKLNHKQRLNGHIGLTAGNVEGQNIDYTFTDSQNPKPSNYFRTNFFSLHYDLQFHILKTEKIMLWVSQGIGLLRFNPRDTHGEELLSQASTRARNEEYSNFTVAFPSNIGFAYFFPNNYGAGIQIGLLNPATDYIDNVSELSNKQRNDNVLTAKLMVLIPISYE